MNQVGREIIQLAKATVGQVWLHGPDEETVCDWSGETIKPRTEGFDGTPHVVLGEYTVTEAAYEEARAYGD